MTGVTSLGHRGNSMAGGVEPRATGSALLENEKKTEKKERKDEAAPLSRGHDGNCGSTGRPATAGSSSSSSSRSPLPSCSCLVSKATFSVVEWWEIGSS